MMNLKSCPFCGGKVHLHFNDCSQCYEIYCRGCGSEFRQFYGVKDETVGAWNRRVGDDLAERMVDDGK